MQQRRHGPAQLNSFSIVIHQKSLIALITHIISHKSEDQNLITGGFGSFVSFSYLRLRLWISSSFISKFIIYFAFCCLYVLIFIYLLHELVTSNSSFWMFVEQVSQNPTSLTKWKMAEPQGEPQSAEEKPKSSTGRAKFETWGYDMYPERRKTDADFTIKDFFSWKSRNNIEQYKCEKKVVDVIKTSTKFCTLMFLLLSISWKVGFINNHCLIKPLFHLYLYEKLWRI